MKKVLNIALLLVFCFILNANAQNDRTANRGLIFSMANATLGNYEGGLGAKMYFTKDMAGRIGFGLALGKDLTTINISPGVTLNLMISKPVTFYTGAEMIIKSASGDNAQNPGFQFGLGGLLGAEWMVDKNVSLSGEYYLLSINMMSPKGGDTQTAIAIGAYAKMLLTFYF
ncbi:MAG: hypothetical protein NTW25_13110 [Candidatus Kapabacteria bacterium]|nr:hypothetical protein [Candidatus Kapabacteria bacterium]